MGFDHYGLAQMLQSQIMSLVSILVVLIILVLIGRWLINQGDFDEAHRANGKRWLNYVAIGIFLFTLVGLVMSAGSIALKDIPRTGFDRGAVIEDAQK